ncbi:sterol O-acyltransferase 2 [Lampris incognitus]|uniref:sterol O-acyltransferase 2 n=1 Tax=Lampris incognitus TaxID=2546036 RepID=UPI0024B48AEB|nr:sterol O-acyltransferase 2 [Lampris incognitus]
MRELGMMGSGSFHIGRVKLQGECVQLKILGSRTREGVDGSLQPVPPLIKGQGKVKVKVLEQVQDQLNNLLDQALTESVQPFTLRKQSVDKMTNSPKSSELFEISHIRTIYHMFIAVLFIFFISTLAVDYIDQGRLVLEFDLLFYAFGKLWTVAWAWMTMFAYTLFVPYCSMGIWGAFYHHTHSKMRLSLGTGLVLATLQSCALGLFPIYVVIHKQLPPASRFIVTLEQIRFLMKSYSFIREIIPVILKNKPKEGEAPRFPTLSSYLYFLFCPTLIYRESYPRNPHIRWDYVAVTAGKILGCLFYGYFILVRLCVPVFRNAANQPFSGRTLVLALFHSTLPDGMPGGMGVWWGIVYGSVGRDWWNSTSFANYYRTWNVVVHDWLYYYGYRDFLWLSERKFRTAAMLSVFIVSAVVHEYAFTMGFGFFYPVMFCLFAVFGVVFNFTMNDKRQSPIYNIIMWTCLFIGQGVQVCLYCQEWYAQIHCPRTGL